MNKILLGSIVTSNSPSGSFDFRNLINVIFTGLLACVPVLANSLITQLPTLEWGNMGWMLPVVLMILKVLSEMKKGQ
ncbi:MAG: hypothetical protein AAB875_02125 [Patescibacteria group bacterium]